jgi:hypothetical protein
MNTVTIRLRRDPAATWTTNNPKLGLGEPGFETDTNKLKIGNGNDHWNDLDYISGGLGGDNGPLQYTVRTGSDDLYIVTNADGRIISSNDGVTWSEPFDTTINIGKIAIYNGVIVYTRGETDGGLQGTGLYHAQSVTEIPTLISGTDNHVFNEVHYLGNYFVAVGYENISPKRPAFAYSKDGIEWTFGSIDPSWNPSVDLVLTDVGYNGIGWLMTGKIEGSDNAGALYTTSLSSYLSEGQWISNTNLPLDVNQIIYATGNGFTGWSVFCEDRKTWYLNTNENGSGSWVDFFSPNGWDLAAFTQDNIGIGQNYISISEIASGIVNNNYWLMVSTTDGQVLSWPHGPTNPDISIPSPYTGTLLSVTNLNPLTITISGDRQPHSGELVSITNPEGLTLDISGNYYVDIVNDHTYALFLDVSKNTPADFSSAEGAYVANSATVTYSHGPYIDSLGYGNGYFYVGNDAGEVYRAAPEIMLVEWTKVDNQISNEFNLDGRKLGDYIVLSNNNRTVTATTEITETQGTTVATNGAILTGQKKIFSMTIDTWAPYNNFTGFGIVNKNSNVNTYAGGENTSIGVYDGGDVYINDEQTITLDINFASDNSVVDVAVDRVNNLLWIRVNDGYWNGNETDDPATAVGGIDISFISGTVYPAAMPYSAQDINSIITSNDTISNIPSGFTFISNSFANGNYWNDIDSGTLLNDSVMKINTTVLSDSLQNGKPNWLEYNTNDTGLVEGTNFGFDNGGMWFDGDREDTAYPIRTNFDINGETVCEITVTLNHNDNCTDQGLCIFNSSTQPQWNWNPDPSRIAFSINCPNPVIYGQTSSIGDEEGGPGVLTDPNYYTIVFRYDPKSETVVVKTYSGQDTSGQLILTQTLNERLPAGPYRIGFDADQDNGPPVAYFTNLSIKYGDSSKLSLSKISNSVDFSNYFDSLIDDNYKFNLKLTNINDESIFGIYSCDSIITKESYYLFNITNLIDNNLSFINGEQYYINIDVIKQNLGDKNLPVGSINILGNQYYAGSPVTVYKPNYGDVVDYIDTGLSLTRGLQGMLYNTSLQTSANSDGPDGTEWNTDGWDDLSDITERTYTDLNEVLGWWQVGEEITNAELVMHDTINDKYYKFDFSFWQPGNQENTLGGGFKYTRTLLWVDQPEVTFVHTSGGSQVDEIDTGISITRSNNKGIYNSTSESVFNPSISPKGTLWNTDGWGDLSNLTEREYLPFYAATNGHLGQRVTDKEYVMHDTINDEYYKIHFTNWGNNSGAAFTYVRQKLNKHYNGTGISFSDGTSQKTAGIPSDTSLVTNSIKITNMVSISQSNYDALATKDPNTLYVINN